MKTIYTAGHSNLDLARFLEIVRDIEVIADVRRFPKSRKFPHFDGDALARTIGYRWFPDLGGRRSGGGTRHSALRVAGFRAYAAHMETARFRAALADLESLAAERRVAVMCAEALWFRCHRWLLSDMLATRGWTVIHLPGGKPHRLSAIARAENGTLVYDVTTSGGDGRTDRAADAPPAPP
ncbi:MAG: DUF488 domain-containing protein [Planctomycetes bacterium]|nr:DUF488 domain-containing protein [Planctomycetota bacterium]